MGFINDKKGQGAVEYLLIIGGAILIAAVVIAIIANTGSKGKGNADAANTELDTAQTALDDLKTPQ